MMQEKPKHDKHPPAHEVVYRSMRSCIMCGEIPPGESMTLRGIANQHSVSMTPAREAIRRLVAEGALQMTKTGRIQTPKLTHERIEELAAIRTLLEPELASRALPRARMALVEKLEIINTTNTDAILRQDPLRYVRTNLDFHRTLYLRAQAPAILALAETVWLQLGPTMRVLYGRLNLGRTALPRGHRLIIDAIKAGDEPALRMAIRADITCDLHLLAS